jgi:adenine-specific DNA-methyltransferase
MKPHVPSMFTENLSNSDKFSPSERIVVYPGDCLEMLRAIPAESMQLIVTSPPYNIGKEYEKRLHLDLYLRQQAQVIAECVRTLSPTGSICWQVGNYVDRGAIIPLDTVLYPIFSGLGLRMRNRIIWHFEHGLHCSRRFSGRYETIIWFTKSDEYVFNLNAVRVPQKYPGKKYFKGPKAGQYSCNPLGKNPGDLWVIPNVKSNHVEKTEHPCQFPVELIERLVLSRNSSATKRHKRHKREKDGNEPDEASKIDSGSPPCCSRCAFCAFLWLCLSSYLVPDKRGGLGS